MSIFLVNLHKYYIPMILFFLIFLNVIYLNYDIFYEVNKNIIIIYNKFVIISYNIFYFIMLYTILLLYNLLNIYFIFVTLLTSLNHYTRTRLTQVNHTPLTDVVVVMWCSGVHLTQEGREKLRFFFRLHGCQISA